MSGPLGTCEQKEKGSQWPTISLSERLKLMPDARRGVQWTAESLSAPTSHPSPAIGNVPVSKHCYHYRGDGVESCSREVTFGHILITQVIW